MSSDGQLLFARHIQNASEGTAVHYWGYPDRIVPCTKDAGTCAYLDLVYSSHVRGMLYIGIIWATFGAAMLVWTVFAQWQKSKRSNISNNLQQQQQDQNQSSSSFDRTYAAVNVGLRRYLLPDGPRFVFGRTSRLQIVILAVFAGYLLIWSFVGITYQTWITPIKGSTLSNTRTSLGPWSDRIGILAYGLLPFSIMLSSRESLLTLLTGVPYHHFNFLHRWLGYVILIQSVLHTIGWTIIEARLYQPQPSVGIEWIKQTYIIWGCVATLLILLLWVLTLPAVIRRTGYEFFRKAHYILAMLFIGACWGHWAKLQCFLIPSFALWGIDRFARLCRSFLLHYNIVQRNDGTTWVGFQTAKASAQLFDNDSIVRLDFDQPQTQAWHVGQHFYLTFTDSSIWQSHPLTPLSWPYRSIAGTARHTYLFRAKGGETGKVARLLKAQRAQSQTQPQPQLQTGVLLTGPYGANIVDTISDNEDVLCVAGGTGITFVLPAIFHFLRNQSAYGMDGTGKVLLTPRRIELVWIVRHAADVQWIQPELDLITRDGRVHIHIHSTRDDKANVTELKQEQDQAIPQTDACFCGTPDEKVLQDAICPCDKEPEEQKQSTLKTLLRKRVKPHIDDHRPVLGTFVDQFMYNKVNCTSSVVLASGPGSMLSELKQLVAERNSAAKVMRGAHDGSVRFVSDNRLEW